MYVDNDNLRYVKTIIIALHSIKLPNGSIMGAFILHLV